MSAQNQQLLARHVQQDDEPAGWRWWRCSLVDGGGDGSAAAAGARAVVAPRQGQVARVGRGNRGSAGVARVRAGR